MSEEEELLKKIKEEAPFLDLEVSEKATKLLKGKKIVLVLIDDELKVYGETGYEEKENSKELSVRVDEGKVILVLEDGTKIIAWNSEWGGIRITKEALGDVLL